MSSSDSAAAGLQEEVGVGVPILWRLNRLDHILKHLEDIKRSREIDSPRSPYSYASTNSTATTVFSGDISPDKNKEKLPHCRPVDQVLIEVEQKGTLIQRLIQAEDRIFKLCLQMEEELESETRSKELHTTSSPAPSKDEDNHNKGGLKKLIKSCVKRGGRKKASKNY